MLRSLLLAFAFSVVSAQTFAHDEHHYDGSTVVERSYEPLSCRTESRYCIVDKDAVKWIHKLLHYFDSQGIHDQSTTKAIAFTDLEYEYLIHALQNRMASVPDDKLSDHVYACKASYKDLYENIARKATCNPKRLASVFENFCTNKI